MATVVPFPELLRAAAPAHVTPLGLEHDTFTALAGGVLHPEKFGVTALTWTVKAAGLNVVLKETLVVEGMPVTLPAGLLEVNVTELGVTLQLLTVAYRGRTANARAAAAIIVSCLTYIVTYFPLFLSNCYHQCCTAGLVRRGLSVA
ncbi:MAG: hypothetical protein DMG30_28905 [Acidobacteria bacterium]|nr:MAG: hypothetical protein DMG30_28905 [Acidobacteriota bacterium]